MNETKEDSIDTLNLQFEFRLLIDYIHESE
jgi:hypothetical protein